MPIPSPFGPFGPSEVPKHQRVAFWPANFFRHRGENTSSKTLRKKERGGKNSALKNAVQHKSAAVDPLVALVAHLWYRITATLVSSHSCNRTVLPRRPKMVILGVKIT